MKRLITVLASAILLASCNEKEVIRSSLTLNDIRFPEHTEIEFPVNHTSGKIKASFLILNCNDTPPENVQVYFDSSVQRLRPIFYSGDPQVVGNYYSEQGALLARRYYSFMGGTTEYYYDSLGLTILQCAFSCMPSCLWKRYYLHARAGVLYEFCASNSSEQPQNLKAYSVTEYKIDSFGRVLSKLVRGKGKEREYSVFRYTGEVLSGYIHFHDPLPDIHMNDETLASSYRVKTVAQNYYTNNKIDSTIMLDITNDRPEGHFFRKTIYNHNQLPVETIINDSSTIYHRYLYYD